MSTETRQREEDKVTPEAEGGVPWLQGRECGSQEELESSEEEEEFLPRALGESTGLSISCFQTLVSTTVAE